MFLSRKDQQSELGHHESLLKASSPSSAQDNSIFTFHLFTFSYLSFVFSFSLSILSSSQAGWSFSSSLGSPGVPISSRPSLPLHIFSQCSFPPSCQNSTLLLKNDKEKHCLFPGFWVSTAQPSLGCIHQILIISNYP